MNSCEITLKQLIVNQINLTKQSTEKVISDIAESISDKNLDKTIVQSQLKDLLHSSVYVTDHPLANIISFFEINKKKQPVVYEKVKREIKNRVINSLFNSSMFNLSPNGITKTIKILQKQSIQNLGCKSELNLLGKVIDMNLNKEYIFNSSSAIPYVVDYLLAVNPSLVTQAFLSDIISYDPNTDIYSLNVKSYIREDWKEEEKDKEAEINSLLNILCEHTPMRKFKSDGTIDLSDTSLSKFHLTKNAFLFAAISEIKNMDNKDYREFIRNPYYLITYLKNKYGRSGNFNSLAENVMHSFVNQWICYTEPNGTILDRNLVKNSQAINNKATGYNPLDIIIKNINKYNFQTYIEYDLKNSANTSRLSVDISDTSVDYMRACGNIDNIVKQNISILSPIITIDNGKYIKHDAQLSDIITVCKQIFENNIYVDEQNIDQANQLFNLICNYANIANDNSTFRDYLIEKTKTGGALLKSFLTNINKFNPYVVKGSVKSKLGKMLPIMSLVNVGSDFDRDIELNHERINRTRKKYESLEQSVYIPTAPCTHSTLFKYYRKDTNNPFLNVVYRDSISTEVNNDPIIKETSKLSIPEAFELSIKTDFLQGWESNGIIRIQSITPSEKPKIPFYEFSSEVLKEIYGDNNSDIEANVYKEIRTIYTQILANTINNIIDVLDLNSRLITENDISENNLDNIWSIVDSVNQELLSRQITQDKLNKALQEYNTKYNLNKNIAQWHDYDIVNGIVQISRYSTEAVKQYSSINSLDSLYASFLYNIYKFGKIDEAKDCLVVDEDGNIILNDKIPQLNKNAKESPLYTYFLLQNVLSENILVNTVGLPLSHKNKRKGSFFTMDSESNVTMVKRMVAQTATLHGCEHNSLSGLNNEIKTMVVSNDTASMFSYSGNVTSGKDFSTDLDVADGAMYSCKFVNNLLHQSITDTKPKSIMQKLFLHSYDPENANSMLFKMANCEINNAMIRMFNDDNVEKVGGVNSLWYMELSTRNAFFRQSSVNKEGQLIDYNGKVINQNIYVNRNNIIFKIKNIKLNNDCSKFSYDEENTITKEINHIENIDNNLYNYWKYALGGEWSCNKDGNYDESSQDNLSQILNSIGIKKEGLNGLPKTQDDVDQYLKNEVISYFCTDSGNKSCKMPVTDIRKAIKNNNDLYTHKVYIDHFGIQQDPDHEAADAHVKEITQLISFMTEQGYVPEKVDLMYNNLSNLLSVLAQQAFINLDLLNDQEKANLTKKSLDNLFLEKLTYLFKNPNTDVMGMANEIIEQIDSINDKLLPPYSDHQLLGKLHTTVGSYLNGFISRVWTGRGDVLVPSHNMFMLYEDSDGSTYLVNDFHYNEDGSRIPIKEYLHSKVWGPNGAIRSDYIQSHIISPYEVMPVDVYYKLIPGQDPEIVIIDTYEKLRTTSDEIKAGIVYVKAIDLPRNLRSKRAYIDVTINDKVHRIGLWHFKTMKEIADAANARDYTRKEELQNYMNEIILPGIHRQNEIDIKNIRDELDESLFINNDDLFNPISYNIDKIQYISLNSERITANNYSNKFGIPNMNFAEIQQRKEGYFKEKLLEKFSSPDSINLENSILLYPSNGKATVVVSDINNYKLNATIEIEPIINEEGYRIDRNQDKLYKWPKSAKLYKDTISNTEIIVTQNINELIDDDYFLFYKSDKDLDTKRKYFYNLNNQENKNLIFDVLAKVQYESWLKSNVAVMSRIPSQSLSFAMNINTVAYLPFNNNVTLVPNENTFLEGSDYEAITKL